MAEQIDFITAARDTAIQWARDLLAADPTQVLILDTETTGLDDAAEVIQLGVIDLAGNVVIDTLVKPTKPIPPAAAAIHHITDVDVADAPNWRAVQPLLEDAIKSRTLVIYNAQYDTRLLKQTAAAHGVEILLSSAKSIPCAMLEYAEYVGDWDNYRGSFRWQKLYSGDHSAIGDCLATLKVIQNMAASKLSSESITNKLNRLADLRTAPDSIRLQKQAAIEAVLTAEIKDQLAQIEETYDPQIQLVQSQADLLEEEIKAEILAAGESVKGAHLMAVYAKGRVSWDSKKLDGMMSLIPQLKDARKEGEPTVSFRNI